MRLLIFLNHPVLISAKKGIANPRIKQSAPPARPLGKREKMQTSVSTKSGHTKDLIFGMAGSAKAMIPGTKFGTYWRIESLHASEPGVVCTRRWSRAVAPSTESTHNMHKALTGTRVRRTHIYRNGRKIYIWTS